MREYLENIIGKLEEHDWSLLSAIIREEVCSRGDYLLEAGIVCRNIWFLKQGAIRMFELNEGIEFTTHFFISPSFFTLYHSLLSGVPSELYIKAEENCSLQILPYSSLSKLYQDSHALERIGRIMAEFHFMAEFERRRMHLNMDALQRYEYLEKKQPEVFHHFQLKDIATYLGITPVSLSRLRKYRSSTGK